MKKRNRREAGVTLIEMMVVVVIIALFGAGAAQNAGASGPGQSNGSAGAD